MGHSKEEPYTEEDYRTWDRREDGNIGKRKLFIRVPCSPEEAQFHDTREGRQGTIWEWTKEVEATPEVVEKVQKLKSREKGRSETYLQAMLTVYHECYNVLKPGGYVIIIIKPFVRNKKPVDLPLHTWLLLEKCGFKLVDVLKFRLPGQSFWRVLQYTKCDHSKMVNIVDGKIVHRKKEVWVDDEGKAYDKKDIKKKTECRLFGECKPKLEGKKQSKCASYVNSIERISHEYIIVAEKG